MTRSTLETCLPFVCIMVLLTGCELLSDTPGWGSGDDAIGSGSGDDAGDASDVDGACAPVEVLSCGSVVQGDTADFNTGATTEIDAYAGAVGNYEAAETAYTFVAPSTGEVTFSLIDPTPTEVDHDLFVLDAGVGCTGDAAIARGFNNVTFTAEAGASYYLVVDGYHLDAGAFEISVGCEADAPAPPAEVDECLFGETSSQLRESDHLEVGVLQQYEAVADVPDLIGQQMVQGVQDEGWADVSTLADVWEYVDYDGVFEHGVVEPGGDRFTWVRWYVGDTEVGYIYFEGTLQLAAIVGDGDIHHCTVAR